MLLRSINTLLIVIMLPFSSTSWADAVTEFPGFTLWNSAEVQAAADRLEAKLGDQRLVYETIGSNHPGHSIYLVLRGKSGWVEYHETESDFQMGVRGNAKFVIGGKIVDREVRNRKQERGSAIKGGKTFDIKPGDMIHVPPAIPHQIVVAPNEPYMYLLIKIDEEPLE